MDFQTRYRHTFEIHPEAGKETAKKASEAHGDRTHNLLSVREGCVFGDAEMRTFGV
jgi:hypothetical protein